MRKILLAFLLLAGCDRSPRNEVVLYTSVDEPVARPIIEAFTRETGIRVILKTDTEASKTAGLVEALRAQKSDPQADVFWNNEIFHTINLADEGVLAPYDSPSAAGVAPEYKDAGHYWAGNGLRLRMIALAPGAANITTLEDLTAPALKDKICMANPAFGTTSGHLAALFVKWGPEKGEQFLKQLKANHIRLLGGNSEVVKQIAAGNYIAGLTDNDDVDSMKRIGGRLTAVPADLRDHSGPLAIPGTVALIAGAKHPDQAKKLIDYLLSRKVEDEMLADRYALASVRAHSTTRPAQRIMQVDYHQVARMLPRAIESARRILEGRE